MGKQSFLRRAYVPIEHKTSMGAIIFQTMDKEAYVRDAVTGVIRRVHPKINGKQRKKQRRNRANP